MFILAVPFLLLSNLIVVLFKIKDTFLTWEIKLMNGKNFLLRVMWFFEFWSQVISHYLVKFDVHRTCGIGDIAFFICHETTYNHVLTESCDFLHGGMSYHFVEFGSHEPCENRDITFFTRHASIVSCDHCGWWPLLINHIHFKVVDMDLRKLKYNIFYLLLDLRWPREQKNMWLLRLWLL